MYIYNRLVSDVLNVVKMSQSFLWSSMSKPRNSHTQEFGNLACHFTHLILSDQSALWLFWWSNPVHYGCNKSQCTHFSWNKVRQT